MGSGLLQAGRRTVNGVGDRWVPLDRTDCVRWLAVILIIQSRLHNSRRREKRRRETGGDGGERED